MQGLEQNISKKVKAPDVTGNGRLCPGAHKLYYAGGYNLSTFLGSSLKVG